MTVLFTVLLAAAHLVVTSTKPFTLHGTGFQAGERVRVVVIGASMHRTTVTASRTGRFVVRLRSVELANCGSYIVRATGNDGTTVAMRHTAPECAQGPAP